MNYPFSGLQSSTTQSMSLMKSAEIIHALDWSDFAIEGTIADNSKQKLNDMI